LPKPSLLMQGCNYNGNMLHGMILKCACVRAC